jgi:hypothetical protein
VNGQVKTGQGAPPPVDEASWVVCEANQKRVAARPQCHRGNRHDCADAERLAREAQHQSLAAPSDPRAELRIERAALFSRIRAENAERDCREALGRLCSLAEAISWGWLEPNEENGGKPLLTRDALLEELETSIMLLTDAIDG